MERPRPKITKRFVVDVAVLGAIIWARYIKPNEAGADKARKLFERKIFRGALEEDVQGLGLEDHVVTLPRKKDRPLRTFSGFFLASVFRALLVRGAAGMICVTSRTRSRR